MTQHEKIQSIVLESLAQVYSQIHPGKDLHPSADTVLFGAEGVLDSLGLVTFVVGVEQGIEDALQVTLILADERAVSQKNSPFRTVTTFVNYVERRIAESVHA